MCLEPLSQNNFCLLARFEARTNTQTCDHPERRRRCQRHRRESRYDSRYRERRSPSPPQLSTAVEHTTAKRTMHCQMCHHLECCHRQLNDRAHLPVHDTGT